MKRMCILFFLMAVVTPLLAQQNVNGSLVHDSLTRDYIIHLPTGYDGSAPVPLVVNMHGYTSNAAQQQFYSGMDIVADAEGFIVVYPNGVSNAWNVGFSFNGPYSDGVDDVGFISALIDKLGNDYNIDLQRVYSTGMSNGGFMSYRLACELNNKIAAIASVTGSMTDSMGFYCTSTKAVPVMQVHGTADPTVAYNGSGVSWAIDSVIQFWVDKNGCAGSPLTENLPNTSTTDASTVTRYTYSDCADSAKVVLLKVDNGGHTWPGADIIIGTTNQDIEASQEIWDFFKQYKNESALSVLKNYSISSSAIIFNNPADGELTIRFLKGGYNQLLLYDIRGKLISSRHLAPHSQGMDLVSIYTGGFTPGIYLLKVLGEDGSATAKVVIR